LSDCENQILQTHHLAELIGLCFLPDLGHVTYRSATTVHKRTSYGNEKSLPCCLVQLQTNACRQNSEY